MTIRHQQPWRKRKRSLLEPTRLHQLLHADSEDPLTVGFDGFAIETVDEKIKRVTKRPRFSVHRPPTKDDLALGLVAPYSLYPHQRKAIHWAKHRQSITQDGLQGGIIALEMGLGKTLIALGLILSIRSGLSLIVCNKSLLHSISQDIVKFFGPTVSFFVVHRVAQLDSLTSSWFQNQDLILITYDVLVRLAGNIGLVGNRATEPRCRVSLDFFSLSFRYLICDESQRFINSKTQVFHSLQHLTAQYRFCLTGTPIRNYTRDLHSQLLVCGLDANLTWSSVQWHAAVLRISIVEAGIILPNIETIPLTLSFSESEQQQYDEAYQHSLTVLSTYDAGRTKFASVLKQFGRLRQLCIAPDMVHQNTNSTATKIQRVVTIVRHLPPGEKILIFSFFVSALKLVRTALQQQLPTVATVLVDGGTKIKKRDYLFDQFRSRPDRTVLLLSTSVGCLGLNLSEANHVVLMEPWWNDSVGQQAIARAWRIGQTKKVTVWRLIMKNTIEERMATMAKSKLVHSVAVLAQSGPACLNSIFDR